jgi:predicted small integral membrane protein
MLKNLILIPVYNDWKSLNKLLLMINKSINKKSFTQILIIDDHSSKKINLNIKKLKNIKKIEVIKLKENVGSQRGIAVGLKYLYEKKKRDFEYITIMDGDGEDDPKNLNSMLYNAHKNKDYVVVSCRKDRNENFLIKLGYKIHLMLTFLLTINWMSFGNFSCFHFKNLQKILSNNSVWHAYSAAVKKNTKILRLYAVRAKRFYGNSKVNLIFLIKHSLRIIGVFYIRVFFFSIFYLYILNNFILKNNLTFNYLLLMVNILILSSILFNKLKKNTSFIKKKIK